MPVCLSVCLFVCPLTYVKNHMSKFHEIFCTLPLAVAQYSADENAICYVFPVLWMTSSFRIMVRVHWLGGGGHRRATRHPLPEQAADDLIGWCGGGEFCRLRLRCCRRNE